MKLLLICVICTWALLASLVVADQRFIRKQHREEPQFIEMVARTKITVCKITTSFGVEQYNCPFENAICCNAQQPTCCPQGYMCDTSGSTVKCVKASVTVPVSANNPNAIAPPSSTSSIPPPSEGSAMATHGLPQMPMNPMGESSGVHSNLKQNIIIVKNINVLTKAQQPVPHHHAHHKHENGEESTDFAEAEESSKSEESSKEMSALAAEESSKTVESSLSEEGSVATA